MASAMVDEYHKKVQEQLDTILAVTPSSGAKPLTVGDRIKIRENATAMSLIMATLVGMLASMQSSAEEATKKLVEANVELELLKRKVAELTAGQSEKPPDDRATYAMAVKRNEIFISAKDDRTTSEQIKEAIKKNVDPVKGGVGVSKLVKLPNNKVKLACDSTKDLNWMTKAIQDNTDFQVRGKSFRLPCVKLFGIPKGMPVEEICRTLFAQNEFVRQIYKTAEDLVEAVALRRRFHSVRNEWNHTVVLQVPVNLFQAMMRVQVKFGFESFWAKEFLEPKRCYNCQQFGHVAKDCKGKEVCRKCGNEGHKQRDCKATEPRCAACVLHNETQKEQKPTNHWVASPKCEVGRRLQERLRRNTDYGQ